MGLLGECTYEEACPGHRLARLVGAFRTEEEEGIGLVDLILISYIDEIGHQGPRAAGNKESRHTGRKAERGRRESTRGSHGGIRHGLALGGVRRGDGVDDRLGLLLADFCVRFLSAGGNRTFRVAGMWWETGMR